MNYPQHHNASAPVATFEGYVEGTPLVKWINRASMPPAGTKLYAGAAAPLLSTAPEATRQDLRDVFGLAWNQALADAALYVASHCAVGEHQAAHILELVPPKLRVRGVEIAFRLDEAITLAPEASVRAAFVEWHQDEFGYCCVDDKSFTDGDLQAVAWAAWKEAHARTGARQANGGIA